MSEQQNIAIAKKLLDGITESGAVTRFQMLRAQSD
jgi:hypothetical protein